METDTEVSDMDRLKTVLTLLPQMSRDIIDDTIHEKVLSYLSGYAKKGPDMVAVLAEWNVLDVIRACIFQESPSSRQRQTDYRITSIAIRFLAQLLQNDDKHRARLFCQLITKYREVMTFILDGVFDEDEALMRYSCVEALEMIVAYEEGAKWILESNKSAQIIERCFEDSSTYVVTAISKLLLSIIKNSPSSSSEEISSSHLLLLEHIITSLNLFTMMREMLYDAHVTYNHRMATLEIVWMLASSQEINVIGFLRRGKLLMHLDTLLHDPNRIIRSRANEILYTLLQWVPDPLILLEDSNDFSNPNNTHHSNAFNFILYEIVFSLLSKAADNNFEMVVMSVNVITSMAQLAARDNDNNHLSSGGTIREGEHLASILTSLLVFLLGFTQKIQNQDDILDSTSMPLSFTDSNVEQFLCDNEIVEKLSSLFNSTKRANTHRKTLILNVFHAIQSIAIKFSQVIAVILNNIYVDNILSTPAYNTDERILKAGFNVIPIVLFSKFANAHDDRNIEDDDRYQAVDKILEILNALLKDQNTECRGMTLVLEMLGRLLGNQIIGGYIFDSGYGKHRYGIELVCRFDLEKDALSRIHDPEAYVRASALNAVQAIIRHSEGWQNILSKNLKESIALELPQLMKDTEAFVRRALMDLMICLIVERECGEILLDDKNAEIINPEAMAKIMDDPDFEVRIRGCQFLAVVWDHCEQDRKQGHKRQRKQAVNIDADLSPIDSNNNKSFLIGDDSSWFYWLDGDNILIDAASDSSRLVRREILVILQRIKDYVAQLSSSASSSNNSIQIDNNSIIIDTDKKTEISQLLPHKRPTIESSSSLPHRHADFYRRICAEIDFSRLASTIDAEHLYKEALESVVDSAMTMTMDVEEGEHHRTNSMDCY
ncbi:30_t:CDS:10 [Ambispora leptoticha]|uniref:30_t:CDS:1 n=1 Tax=Ambispora leptoticha TaxID=144679 RepID=A0A9N9AJX6_9GLOM|nr:30_t:CDS:10 [Ambispora leptoticha]